MWLGQGYTFLPPSFSALISTNSSQHSWVVSPQNSNLPVLSPLPLTLELTPEEYSAHVPQPLRMYFKLPSSSNCIETPLFIHIDGPSTFSPISVWNPKQAGSIISFFFVENISFSLSLDASTASDGEFGCFSYQNLFRSLQKSVLC